MSETWCEACDGTGWVEHRHLIPAGYKAGRISARPEDWTDVRLAPCSHCAKGLALAAAQAARRGRVAKRQARRRATA